MSDDGQNFSVFTSRILVDTVGDVTDEALKASRMKEVIGVLAGRSEEHTSELQSRRNLVCRLLLEKKKTPPPPPPPPPPPL